MTPLDYCAERVDLPGSSVHYALVFLRGTEHGRLLALFALEHELRQIIAMVNEPSVAQAKLTWWQMELGRIGSETVTHPVCQALAGDPPEVASIRGLLDAALIDLTQTRHLDWAGLDAYCLAGSGSLARLCALALGVHDEEALDAARRLGAALRLCEIVIHLGADAQRGRIYIPIDTLQEYGITAREVQQSGQNEAFARLARALIRAARERTIAAVRGLDARSRRALRPLVILAAIELCALLEIERSAESLRDERIELTPLRKFVLAWRVWVGWWQPA